jgi:hypothetical protein
MAPDPIVCRMDPGDIPHDDPDVVAGMARLAELRLLERTVVEFPPTAGS